MPNLREGMVLGILGIPNQVGRHQQASRCFGGALRMVSASRARAQGRTAARPPSRARRDWTGPRQRLARATVTYSGRLLAIHGSVRGDSGATAQLRGNPWTKVELAERKHVVARLVNAGLTWTDVAKRSGISKYTIWEWRKKPWWPVLLREEREAAEEEARPLAGVSRDAMGYTVAVETAMEWIERERGR